MNDGKGFAWASVFVVAGEGENTSVLLAVLLETALYCKPCRRVSSDFNDGLPALL